MTMLDVPTNWRRWNGWVAGRGLPDPLEGGIINPECSVLVTEPFDVIELRNWLKANCRDRVLVYGRWDFEQFKYRIDRKLIGLNLWFDNADEAFFAKLRWS